MKLPTFFLYGTAAYRPTNPPPEDFRKHFSCIKHELGFDIVRVRVEWNPINREPDTFDFTELDQVLDLCDELGLQAFLETNLQIAPWWLEAAHPETRYVNALGQAIELGPNEASQIGGYPGLCHHHEAVTGAGTRFLEETARHFRERTSVVGYDCWNEPHLEPAWVANWGSMGERLFCYCEGSRRAFREWLRSRYGDIDELNRTWGRAYRDWDDVNPPNRLGNYADWMDWGRFWHDDLREHMRWRYAVLREEDPNRFIMSHSGAVPPFLPRANAWIHNWKLAEPADMWGTSIAPLAFNWELADIAGVLDATRSAARGKPFWISEMSGGACMVGATPGSVGSFRRTRLPTPADFRVWNWLGVMYGSKATVHWCHLEERHGPESGGFGMVRANGEVTERARGAAQTAKILHDLSPLFFETAPRPQVGILFDPDNSDLLFAMEAGDQLYGDAHVGINRAVWRSDNCARFVTYETLDDLAGLPVLIAPLCMTMPDHVASALAAYVEGGGVLVAEARTGHYDHRGYNRPILPAGLTEVAGAVEDEAICSDAGNRPHDNNPEGLPWPDPIYAGPMIEFSDPVAVDVRTHEYFVPLRPTTGDPIARSMGHCLAVRNLHGRGTAYYLGTYLSLAIHRGDEGAMRWLVEVLARHTSPEVHGAALRPRIVRRDNQALLAVFNESRTETIEETIALPEAYARAVDVYSGEPQPCDGARCPVEVGPQDVRVLRLAT